MTLEEHHVLLKKEGRYEAMIAAQQQRRSEIEKFGAEMRRAEAPLVEALNQVGQKVSSVHDLVRPESRPNAKAVRVLLEHLRHPYPDNILEGIGRALAVPGARVGWAVLLDEFRRNPDRSGQHAKAGLACALAGAADDEHLDDIIGLLKDPRHGYHRLFLLDALAGSKDPRVGRALLELRTDPELAKAVERLLRRKARGRKEKVAVAPSSIRLAEASINLDAGRVEPLLHRIGSLVAGFGAAEIRSMVEALEPFSGRRSRFAYLASYRRGDLAAACFTPGEEMGPTPVTLFQY